MPPEKSNIDRDSRDKIKMDSKLYRKKLTERMPNNTDNVQTLQRKARNNILNSSYLRPKISLDEMAHSPTL